MRFTKIIFIIPKQFLFSMAVCALLLGLLGINAIGLGQAWAWGEAGGSLSTIRPSQKFPLAYGNSPNRGTDFPGYYYFDTGNAEEWGIRNPKNTQPPPAYTFPLEIKPELSWPSPQPRSGGQ